MLQKQRQGGFRKNNEPAVTGLDHVAVIIERGPMMIFAPFNFLGNIALQQADLYWVAGGVRPVDVLQGPAADPEGKKDEE